MFTFVACLLLIDDTSLVTHERKSCAATGGSCYRLPGYIHGEAIGHIRLEAFQQALQAKVPAQLDSPGKQPLKGAAGSYSAAC